MPLTIKEIESFKPDPERDYKKADGEGMYLFITKAGGKHWRFKYRHLGNEKVFTIGEYPYISLAEARDKRFELKKMVELGIDPMANKRELREKAIEERDNTFERIARKWFEHKESGWSKSYASDVIRRLEIDVFPAIGKKPINSISSKDIIAILQGMEKRGVSELARRLKQNMSEIFRYAIVHEYATTNPAANFHSKDILKKVEKTHFATIEAKEIPAFLKTLNQNNACLRPLTRIAIRMLMLTFVRTNELRNARWEEFDLPNKQWLIPAERMKMGKPHLVPLSNQVMALLEEVKLYSRHQEFVFPSQSNPKKTMSDNTILQGLSRLGYKGTMTGHGFRALATTTLQEKLGWKYEIIDRQLAHAPKSKIHAAYDRAVFLPERTQMMQEWADYIDKQAS